MSTRGAPSWTCPWCDRVVPGREARCHCGCDRALALARDSGAGEGQGGGRAVLVVALVALGGLGLYAANRRRSQGAEAAAQAASQRAEPSPTPAMAASGSPPNYGDFRGGPPAYVPPAGWTSPPPRAEAHPAALAPSAKPAEASPPALSALEEEWEKASALLGPRLEKIAMDSSSVESSYYPFATLCLGPNGAEAGSWLLSLKNAPYRGGSGIIITETGGRLDCSSARASLIARANQVKSQLGATEDLARTSSVLPGHWRKLVAAHQLEIWDRY